MADSSTPAKLSVKSGTKTNARRAEILESAAKLFYQKGYHVTTIEDVARDVGMLKGSLYYHIKSKEEMLFELVHEGIQAAKTTVQARLLGVSGPVRELEVAFEGHMDHIIRQQVRVGLLLHEFDSLPRDRQQQVRDLMRTYQNLFVAIIRRGQQQGVFIPGDPNLLVNGILGMGNWIYRWYRPGFGSPPEVVKKSFLQMIMSGIQPRG